MLPLFHRIELNPSIEQLLSNQINQGGNKISFNIN